MSDKHPEKLVELYVSTFGKKPNGNAKKETLIRMLQQEGITYSEEKPQQEAEEPAPVPEKEETPAPKAEPAPKLKEPAPEPAAKAVQDGVPLDETPQFQGQPVHLGQGLKRRYLLFFRKQPRYWTKASIMAMRSVREQIEFPENTTFSDEASFRKCKSC